MNSYLKFNLYCEKKNNFGKGYDHLKKIFQHDLALSYTNNSLLADSNLKKSIERIFFFRKFINFFFFVCLPTRNSRSKK